MILFPSPAIRLSYIQDVMTIEELEHQPVWNGPSVKGWHWGACAKLPVCMACNERVWQSAVVEEWKRKPWQFLEPELFAGKRGLHQCKVVFLEALGMLPPFLPSSLSLILMFACNVPSASISTRLLTYLDFYTCWNLHVGRDNLLHKFTNGTWTHLLRNMSPTIYIFFKDTYLQLHLEQNFGHYV